MKDDCDQSKGGRGGRSSRMSNEDRKLRNRLSQKAFRARQAMRIKELEDRLESRPSSETERIAELEERNAFLASRLFECHKKLESLQVTIKTLSEATAEALDMVINKDKKKDSDANEEVEDDVPRPTSVPSSTSDVSSPNLKDISVSLLETESNGEGDIVIPDLTLDATHQSPEIPANAANWPDVDTGYDEIPNDFKDALQAAISNDPSIFASLDLLESSSPNNDAVFIDKSSPLMWENMMAEPIIQQRRSFTFPQMGPNAYASGNYGPVLVRGPHGQLYRTNSPWSDHITTLEYFLRQKWKPVVLRRNGKDMPVDGLPSSVCFMLSSFICLSWPTMAAWHTYTRAHLPVGSLMAWRLNPTPEMYAAIDPALSPTKLQMTTHHPAIIDWIPYPTLRDKLIIYHSANPHLDDLICEIGNSYVMEVDLARLIAGIPPTRGYVGVWDLVRSIAPEATSSSDTTNLFQPDFENSPETIDDFDEEEELTSGASCLPAPNASVLFGSKVLALKAFKLIGMHKGVGNFLLDPHFFDRHPELFDPAGNIVAHGVPLRPGNRKFISAPQPLDSSVLGRYKELSSWSLSMSSAMITAI
ncbi:uncharacterized protein Z520_02324 [Fonsecaea multimorphosa CBS 102226]|uniref:BZIP domain-containing protein n=1 Tax=Fonsecaea multimorphosa CBS 102226 TaxID=1442371 RepID=A0A0D2HJV4_9EURO|nr:uncharacterized protein Z520_02324 [Fonsecaea multimorphosa CBS 102226]KIY02186.1 hypothetical protein Z520_02324 [Fonsecaea multimorphosa CBS 102226]OAL29379.1 hypothetical protein AYO22_02273 [Fonsecaea multimorphosa]